jgi:DNA-binding response OmpR family regulator
MDSTLNIVLVEDHDALREITADVLRQAGHHVTSLTCAEEMDEVVGGGAVDLFVLDLNLPGEDGISLAQRVRQAHPAVGIIMVTARGTPEQMTSGYSSGADMYLVKPLASETLIAAVDSLGRRLKPAPQVHGLQLNTADLTLSGPLGTVTLQEVESTLLTAFARAPGQRLETWQIAEILGNPDNGFSKSGIEVRMTRLRKKLRSCGANSGCIKSLRTVGYQLCETLRIV